MKNNQKGFSVIEVVIVIVVIALLGTVGWLVYDRQSSKKNAQSTNTNSAETISPTTTKNDQEINEVAKMEFIEIKELGIKIKNSEELKTFTFGTSGRGDGAVIVNESNVTDLFNKCGSNNTNFAILELNKNEGQYVEGEGNFYEESLKQFDVFYITGGRADGGILCDTQDKTQQLEEELLKATNIVVEAIKNSQKL